jgi:uncharacterized RDD family membrane protein YckC
MFVQFFVIIHNYYVITIIILLLWIAIAQKSFSISANWSFGGHGMVSRVVNQNPLYALYFLMVFVLYFIITESIWGATAGKFLTGQKVVSINKQKAPFLKVILRNILMFVDIIVGPIFFLFSKKNQSVGDKVTGTIVVRKKNINLDVADINISATRKVFASLFVLALIAIVTMSIITIPKIKYLNNNAVSMVKDAQLKVSTNDIDGLYQLFVPQYRDQVPLDKFKESVSSDKFLELVSSLNAENIKFYKWDFDDKDMLVQGKDGSSSVEIVMEKQLDSSWKLISLAIDNPEIENTK